MLFESLGYRNHGAQETTCLVNHGCYQVFGLHSEGVLAFALELSPVCLAEEGA